MSSFVYNADVRLHLRSDIFSAASEEGSEIQDEIESPTPHCKYIVLPSFAKLIPSVVSEVDSQSESSNEDTYEVSNCLTLKSNTL